MTRTLKLSIALSLLFVLALASSAGAQDPRDVEAQVRDQFEEEYGSRGEGFFFSLSSDRRPGSDQAAPIYIVTRLKADDDRAFAMVHRWEQGKETERVWRRDISRFRFEATKLNRVRGTSHIYLETHRQESGKDIANFRIVDISTDPPTQLASLTDVVEARGFLMSIDQTPRVLIVQSADSPLNQGQPPYEYRLYSLQYTGREYFLFDPVNRIREDSEHPEAEINNKAVELYKNGELLRAKDGFRRAMREAELNPSNAVNIIRANMDIVDYHLSLIDSENYTGAGMISSIGQYSDAKSEFLRGNFSQTYSELSSQEKTAGLTDEGLYLAVVSLAERGNWGLLKEYNNKIWDLPEDKLRHLLVRVLPTLEDSNFELFRYFMMQARDRLGEQDPVLLLWKARILSESPDTRDQALRMLENAWLGLDLTDPAGARCGALYYELLTLNNRPQRAQEVFERFRKVRKADLEPVRRVMSLHLQNYPTDFPTVPGAQEDSNTTQEEMLERFREQMD